MGTCCHVFGSVARTGLSGLEAGLLEDAVHSSLWQAGFRMRDRHLAGLGRVLELVMAAVTADLEPAILGQQINDFFAAHRRSPDGAAVCTVHTEFEVRQCDEEVSRQALHLPVLEAGSPQTSGISRIALRRNGVAVLQGLCVAFRLPRFAVVRSGILKTNTTRKPSAESDCRLAFTVSRSMADRVRWAIALPVRVRIRHSTLARSASLCGCSGGGFLDVHGETA